MFFSTMVDMAKPIEKVKEETTPVPMGAGSPTTPVYPWGLCISLDDDTLAKLKLDGEMPSVGEMIHLCAMAKVTSVSENEQEDGSGGKKTCRRVELQITHLATESEDEENDRSIARQGRFYGGGDKAA